MGKKKRDDLEKEASQPVVESKRARRGAPKIEKEKPKKTSANEKSKDAGIKVGSGVVKKEVGSSEVSKNLKGQNVYTDTSSSSDSESEKTSNKNDKKSVTDSNSDSDSDSSDSSDSSPPSREGPEDSNKVKTHKSPAVTKEKNSVTNLMPVKSYVSPEKSSSSDSYHSDTEEEDKKRRKKQKKLLQMQLTKKAKKTNFHRAAEVKSEVQTDVDEDGGDNVNSNNDEVPDWPESDYAELIRRMEAQIPPKDNQKFDSRAAKLDWSKISFGEYSPEECLEVWLAISKRIRRYRILAEILQDAREWVTKPWTNFYRGPKKNRHPDMPPRPLSTYMIYYLEQKDKVAKENPGLEMTQVSKIISEMYKNLSMEERDKYTELAAKQRQNFDAKLSEFYREHPEIAQQQQQKKSQAREVTTKGPRKASNPFKLFFQEQLKKHGGENALDKKNIENKAKEKWKNLSDEKKLFWIDWALQDHKRYEDEMRVYRKEHPDYVPPVSSKSVLNKDERNIKERLAGKPIKPPNSAYSLYSRLMLQNDPDVKSKPPKQRMAEISKMWKTIPDSQKAHYEKEVRALQDSYKLDFASYLEGLPPEERDRELRKNQPKRKPSKAEEKAKKKAIKNSSSSSKSNSKSKDLARLNLYKGEPEPPPVRVFDVFYQSFLSERHQSGTESERLKEALKNWSLLSEAKKKVYRKKHKELKQKYIRDFETFLKHLSPEELKEFSVMKELAKKNKEIKEKEINGDGGESNEESDDENGSSSDSDSEESDSDDTDSVKSSKSSSSSEDSEC